jgi:DNA-binding response OmpR family regulator
MSQNRKKILLVDDDSSIRQQGRALLKDLYEVFPLPSARKMFEVLENVAPDLILLDITMPEMNGFDAMSSLKNNPSHAKIPVIFLTASNDRDSVLKGLQLGPAGFVTKPFSSIDLTEHIENILNPHKDDRKVILAVDDAPNLLKTVHSALRDKYKVYTLPKPENLETMLLSIKPDLFLLDYKMPHISGFDLVPLIREAPEHKETPIIFLTSEGTKKHVIESVGIGACDFIVKPFNIDVLREKIEKHI